MPPTETPDARSRTAAGKVGCQVQNDLGEAAKPKINFLARVYEKIFYVK